jgi:hypothetical protein
MQWNVAVEQSLGSEQTVTATYLGFENLAERSLGVQLGPSRHAHAPCGTRFQDRLGAMGMVRGPVAA